MERVERGNRMEGEGPPVRVEIIGLRGRGVRLKVDVRPTWRRRLALWLRALAEMAGVVGLFVAAGVAWHAAERVLADAGDAREAAPYAPRAMPENEAPEIEADDAAPPDEPRIWLVDGYNVLHAGVLRGRDRREWWSAASQARLLAVVETFDDPHAEIWVVFDDARPGSGERCAVPEAGCRARVAFAPSADDWLVKRVRTAERPGELAVVTADRQVRERSRHRGARVVSPLAFLARCDRSEKAADA